MLEENKRKWINSPTENLHKKIESNPKEKHKFLSWDVYSVKIKVSEAVNHNSDSKEQHLKMHVQWRENKS